MTTSHSVPSSVRLSPRFSWALYRAMTTASHPIPNTPLPTLDSLGATIPADLDVKKVATQWFTGFSDAMVSNDTQAFSSLFVTNAFWRDILALTWDFRTFSGLPAITRFLSDRLTSAHATAFRLRDDASLKLQWVFSDLAWIFVMFDFETDTGIGLGIARLVPNENGEWKAYSVFTHLEDLKGFPERIGVLRNPEMSHRRWEEVREKEKEFVDEDGRQQDPVVLIIGGGHSGLNLAARLKSLNVPTLVVDKTPRIGDSWRDRYESLSLHDTVRELQPNAISTMANWLALYAEALELNVWTSSTVTSAEPDASNTKWNVTVKRGDGTEQVFLHVKHVVFATGLGGGEESIKLPVYPGMDRFKGAVMHSTAYKTAVNYKGKKVVIIGACTSGHDIAVDHCEQGIDVTIYQRSSTYVMSARNGAKVYFSGLYSEDGPPTAHADLLMASTPTHMGVGVGQRMTAAIAELDKDLLDGLRRRGFNLNFGIHDSGLGLLALSGTGGFYIDTGASQLIVDGKIKVKNGAQIEKFTEGGIKFDDGSELEADVVIFATGYGDRRDHIRRVCGDAVVDKCKPIWGLDREGETCGVARDTGVKGLWYIMGNFAGSRFHSKHLALQIKAMEEGVFGERYSSDE